MPEFLLLAVGRALGRRASQRSRATPASLQRRRSNRVLACGGRIVDRHSAGTSQGNAEILRSPGSRNDVSPRCIDRPIGANLALFQVRAWSQAAGPTIDGGVLRRWRCRRRGGGVGGRGGGTGAPDRAAAAGSTGRPRRGDCVAPPRACRFSVRSAPFRPCCLARMRNFWLLRLRCSRSSEHLLSSRLNCQRGAFGRGRDYKLGGDLPHRYGRPRAWSGSASRSCQLSAILCASWSIAWR